MNEKKINVLLFPSCAEVAMATHECLKNNRLINIFGASSNGSVSKNSFKNLITGIPNVKSPEFVKEINNIIEKFNIDILYPCNDISAYEISKNSDKINAKIIGSSFLTNEVAFFKSKTYHILKDIVDVPKIFNNTKNINEFPVFLKPDSGHSAINTFKVDNLDEIQFYISKFNNLLICEYLPGDEYTIDCFTDKYGKLLYAQARQRVSIKSGMSSQTILVNDNSLFFEMALKINDKLKFRNGWFFQVKKNINDKLYLMEISTRPAGNSEISLANNVNIPMLSIYDIMDYDIEIIDKKLDVEMCKIFTSKYNFNTNSFDSVYIDLDDTIIIDNMVNTDAIKFLYECINLKKEIFLITRHKFNVMETLDEFKIPSTIFNKIIHVKDGTCKSDYIDKNTISKTIFIDDSFRERKDFIKIGVNSYDVNMISKIFN